MKKRLMNAIYLSLFSMVALVTLCAQNAQWDNDGGYTGDYSSIPRLEWAGPGQPGTYAEYMAGRVARPMETALIHASVPGQGKGRAAKALVLVEASVQPGIQTNLDRYVADLESDGYTVEVHTIAGGTPQTLKTFIINHSTDLVGCTFVGDLPVAWYEMDIWGHEEFPCDLYYMDLDGTWSDSDNDGLWDNQVAGSGDVGPEIFIGHIDTSMMSGDEATTTNFYLDKNHAYRIGNIAVPGYALSYTEDDWAMFMDMRTDIKHSYPDFDDIPAPETNKNDYLNNRVDSTDYEFIQLCCHSSPELHQFTRGGYCWNYEIVAKVPYAMFYNLFCCSTLRYTTSDFLGGAYIYNTSTTSVAVIGSTKTGSMLVFSAFYEPFGRFETFGESFRQWFNYIAPYDDEEKAWHFGMTIAGDPFLTMMKPAMLFDFPNGLPEGKHFPGPETVMIVEIEAGQEQAVPGTELMHYRFDPSDPFTAVSMTALGNDLYEAVLPNTRPDDKPEFYFSVEGDGGTTIRSPGDAPASVYSFEVGFSEIVWEDDFETHQGWSVVNTNVDTGAFELADPEGTDAQPEDDHSADGSMCYVTGASGGSTGDNDLDGGPTVLISPTLDLSGGDAQIHVSAYFYHSDYGAQQPMQVELSDDDGLTWELAGEVTHYFGWQELSYTVSDFVTPNATVKIRFSASDNPNDDIVEALIDDFSIQREIDNPSLWADGYAITVSARTEIDLSVDAGIANADRNYLLLGTLSGTSPGFALPGGAMLPLNWDAFTDLLLAFLNTPVCANFYGQLDGTGQAAATLDTFGPIDPTVIGETAHFAFTLNKPFDFTSNAIPVEFVP